MHVTPELGFRPYTGAELERLPETDCRYELVRGELITLPFHGALHGLITARLCTYLFPLRIEERGMCFSVGTGFYLSRNPDTVLAPDGAFIRNHRVPHPLPDGYSDVVPDLIVETRDPDQSPLEVALRMERWVTAGATVVLDVDPQRETIGIHRSGCNTVELQRDAILRIEELLPGVRVPLARVFRYSAG